MIRNISMSVLSRCLLVGIALLTTMSMAGPKGSMETPLPMFNAVYSLKRNGIILGTSTRSLANNEDGTYTYTSNTHATGIISWFVRDQIDEYSKWTFNGEQIRPMEYVYDRHGGIKSRNVNLKFDWQNLTVTNTIDGDAWHMSIPSDAQDKLVYQLAIMYDLSKGKKALEYKIADGGKLKDYSFEIDGEEFLNTTLGKLKTLRIQRIGDKRDTTVWCAPELSFLPVRLEQQDTDGSHLSMQITALQGIHEK
jgi:Protein of unknown function (DUF3108)